MHIELAVKLPYLMYDEKGDPVSGWEARPTALG